MDNNQHVYVKNYRILQNVVGKTIKCKLQRRIYSLKTINTFNSDLRPHKVQRFTGNVEPTRINNRRPDENTNHKHGEVQQP